MIQKFRDLPPKKQIWFWLAMLIVLIPLQLQASGGSLRDAEARFRRLEAAEFLGPMEVLGQIETGAGNYPTALLAADEHTAAVYLYSPYAELLLSQKRDGAFTLLSGRHISSLSWYTLNEEPFTLPLVLFDRHPRAIRAELTIETEDVSWTLGSVRDGRGWFRFDLITPGSPSTAEYLALEALYTRITQNGDADIVCTARFYGAAGDLIAEERA